MVTAAASVTLPITPLCSCKNSIPYNCKFYQMCLIVASLLCDSSHLARYCQPRSDCWQHMQLLSHSRRMAHGCCHPHQDWLQCCISISAKNTPPIITDDDTMTCHDMWPQTWTVLIPQHWSRDWVLSQDRVTPMSTLSGSYLLRSAISCDFMLSSIWCLNT